MAPMAPSGAAEKASSSGSGSDSASGGGGGGEGAGSDSGSGEAQLPAPMFTVAPARNHEATVFGDVDVPRLPDATPNK